jgi:hypothetical protein
MTVPLVRQKGGALIKRSLLNWIRYNIEFARSAHYEVIAGEGILYVHCKKS